MYCPECGVEYRPGFSQCSDCLIPLVCERPRRTRKYATVLEESDPILVASATDLLEEFGIPFHLRREERGEDGGAVDPEIVQLCRVEVALESEVEARAILESVEDTELRGESEGEQAPAPEPDLELVIVFEGNDRLMIASAKSALNRAGIPYYVQGGEIALHLLPCGSFLRPWCRIQVAADRQAEALEIIRPFDCGDADEAGAEE